MRDLIAVSILLTNAICSSQLLAAPRPNVVIIFTDDQGYGDLGCYGLKTAKTPNLDRLAKEGARFTSFYTQPVCGPARSALLSAERPGSEAQLTPERSFRCGDDSQLSATPDDRFIEQFLGHCSVEPVSNRTGGVIQAALNFSILVRTALSLFKNETSQKLGHEYQYQPAIPSTSSSQPSSGRLLTRVIPLGNLLPKWNDKLNATSNQTASVYL